jgi:hypothetical protein
MIMVSKPGGSTAQAERQRGNNGKESKADRRKQVDPTTCERDYRDDEVEFMRAMDAYKRNCGRPFPTWSEVLEVVLSLGYRKVETPTLIDCEKRRDQ